MVAPLSEDHASGTLVPRIVEVALDAADRVLAADGEQRLTGADLLRRAARVREAVLAAGARGRPVAVLRGHDVGAVAAVVGVLAAGSPVVVLDPTTPAARLGHYVRSAGASICVSDAARAGTAAELAATVLDPDAGRHAGGDHRTAAEELLATPAHPEDVAVVVYTSGSTGAPKGVACDHRSILHDAWVNSLGTGCYGAGSVVAHLLPMGFSAGIGVTLACLLVGARQELFDPRRRSVAELPAWMREAGVDVLHASPAILRGAMTALAPGERLDGLVSVTVAGETVHGAELRTVRAAVGPRCVLRNRYGSTETWLMAEFRLDPGAPSPEGATPVGCAVPGARFEVQDEDGRRHPHGTGRVVVTSPWLTRGYWGAPERTAEVFTQNPDGTRSFLTSDVGTLAEDGCLRLLGRSDHSVKVRGLLVEPGEVDALLFAHPQVREAVVVGRTDPASGQVDLVAYVVPEGPRLQASAVRAVVRENLPSHMVPRHVVLLDALPRTERGKLDRSALPEPAASSAPYEQPRTGWEHVVHEQFAAVLELERFSVHDDFFELGGDSLAAEALVQRMAELVEDPPRPVTTSLVAAAPTVAQFAAAVRRTARSERPTLVPLRPAAEGEPLFLVAGAGSAAVALRTLAHRVRHPGPVLGLQANGLENRALPDWSVRRIARRHLATVRELQPNGPYRLAGHSMGGLVAFEMASRLRAAGEEVALLVVLDSFPPDPSLMPPRTFPSLRVRLKQEVSVALTGILPHPGMGHYMRFHHQGILISRWYSAPAYDGPALVVVAADEEEAPLRSRWERHLTGEWSLVQVPGDHMSILRDPHVEAVAGHVSQALERVPAAARAPREAPPAAPGQPVAHAARPA
ncbi:AMP-binding protein [Kineococcus indalonis]|uniref:AMP-binding protein n=1 Tax=Kineococcus indalonis TaxID=2696566 RepID=UPI0014133AB0|nr:AMP-binding protein [Kineococcus indalonis]NAZ87426.1 AMP-binding protein [Kineococcus indalonis]